MTDRPTLTMESIILAASEPPNGYPEEEVRRGIAKALADSHVALLKTLIEKLRVKLTFLRGNDAQFVEVTRLQQMVEEIESETR